MSYVSFEWAGDPNASESIKYVDGVEVARNRLIQPVLSDRTTAWGNSSQVSVESVPGTGALVIADAGADVQSSTQIFTLSSQHAVTRSEGDITYSFFKVTNPPEAPRPIQLRPRVVTYYSDDTPTQWGSGPDVWVDPGETVEMFYESTALPNPIHARVAIVPGTSQNFIEGDSVLIHDGWTVQTNADSVEMFHGDTPNYFTGTTYEWAGEPHASESIKRVDGVEVARNLVTNPSSEQATGLGGNWRATLSRSDETSVVGEYSSTVRCTSDLGSMAASLNLATVSAGREYTAQTAIRSHPENGASTELTFLFDWLDANGSQISRTTGSQSITVSEEWQTHTDAATAPEGAVELEIRFILDADEGDLYYLDAMTVQLSDTFETYFDGDTTNDYTPPTFLVRQDGEWKPALPRVFTGGAYHLVPMKQYENEGYL